MTHGWLIDRVKGGKLPVWETTVAHFTLADFLSTNGKINILLGRQQLEALESRSGMGNSRFVQVDCIHHIQLGAKTSDAREERLATD